MGMGATLLAKLGWEGREYSAGIDGAKKKTEEMEYSLRSVRKGMHMAFAIGGMQAVIGAYKELKQYQSEGGTKILSDDALEQLDAAADSLKEIKMQVIGVGAVFASNMVQGVKAATAALTGFFSGARGEELRQIMASSIEGSGPGTAATEREIFDFKVRSKHKELEIQRELMTKMEKQLSLEKELAEVYQQYKAEHAGDRVQTKEDIADREKILALQGELATAARAVKEEQAAWNLKSDMETDARSLQRVKDQIAEAELIRETREKADAHAVVMENKRQLDKEEKAKRLAKRLLRLTEESEKEIADVKAGKHTSLAAVNVGGGPLQSIGGYFASQSGIKASQGSRSERLQEEIKLIQERTAKAVERLSDSSEGD